MNIARDRYLDDTNDYQIRLVLQTSTQIMHSALSDASEEIREQVGTVLVRALNEVQAILQPIIVRADTKTSP
jgi:hypothetical protein